MVAASQLSLMPAHVPADRPKVAAVETLSLFTSDELQSAARTPAKDSAQITQGLRILKGDERSAAGATWARILRTERGRDAAKRVAADFGAAGTTVSLRTVQGWLNGRLADEPYIVLADQLYGGVIAEIYEPDGDAAAAARKDRLRRAVESGR